ncbi:malate synthase G [Thiohalophilus thiocyanatoxydans]|uniref:Malate synthase G n=1 Tax=Thiohalophilus thiocyanatoxydans TaxID=381308 RepID=A0A4V3H3Y5_9GAMM|nr:malate synthase G [Thiohalophilus thiocyanatoxydans]TDY01125.1 malate synthase [Thiohalophilus thiocyanatoxydans]
MTQYIQAGELQIDSQLHAFIMDEALPGSGIDAGQFWTTLSEAVHQFGPRNHELLERRDQLQAQIDAWHREHPRFDDNAYKQFLIDLGYLLPEGDDFSITTAGVDDEIARVAGPQLVVPVSNARYALNAANARWGSLYDALYGTDVIDESDGAERTAQYNPERGARVVARAMSLLDEIAPLERGSHAEVSQYLIKDNALTMVLDDGPATVLKQPARFAGFNGQPTTPDTLLLRHHGLHIELQIDRQHPVGQSHPAGIKDILLEAALTTIQDLEDSVATVDAADKVQAYRNWLGLMQGNLTERFAKSGKTLTRRLNPDRQYQTPNGDSLTLPGRSLLLIRNVGLFIHTDAIVTHYGAPIPEGILDALVTTLIGLHDIRGNSSLNNSRHGSIYLVKPKLHGPGEVAYTNELFDFIEDQLQLTRHTLKLGIMDEERRTSLNLKECIRAAKDRVVFINTGFLDRTGDEIHTSMEAGPMVRKGAMKESTWIQAYENANVEIGLACGFTGKAQIGKGMWAMPDEMKAMLATKINHPRAGANTAWVPSPTAAVLHAIHYHQVNVFERQQAIVRGKRTDRNDLLVIPVMGATRPDETEICQELENNAQGILGYVVRWINQGIGCSKVPDINNTGLMEDRATLRIASQHIANWLHHGLCDAEQVLEVMKRMAEKVDRQNRDDPAYIPMGPDFNNSQAFRAAFDLVIKGREQANGYTEPLLYTHRRAVKEKENR